MGNELHTMPVKVEALLSSQRVRMLELDEFGAYIKLLCDAWLNGATMPKNSLANAWALAKILTCSLETAERVKKNVVDIFFSIDESGDFYNANQREIYAEVCAKHLTAITKGKIGAEKRWGKMDSSTNAQAIAGAIAEPMLKQCHPNSNQSQSQNQIYKERVLTYSKEKIAFDFSTGKFLGIGDDDVKAWREAFPAVDVDGEILRAALWLASNPTKRKSNYLRFLTSWMSRAQDRGGSAPASPAKKEWRAGA